MFDGKDPHSAFQSSVFTRGSTAYSKEKEVYGLFVKYIRQVASGRRPPVTLSSILIFVTSAAEEPVLGFTMQPTITFVNGHANDQVN